MTRVLWVGIVGGIAMFIWSWVAHDLLPLGDAGIKVLPNESAAMPALQTATGDKRGLYMFGAGMSENPTAEEKSKAMKEMNERFAKSPSGMLLYYPAGRQMNMGRLLGVEFATECLQAILVIFLLSQTTLAGFGGKFGFVFVAGILAAIATNVSYWNWYGFPKHYIGAYMLIQVVGFACVGLVAGALARTRSS